MHSRHRRCAGRADASCPRRFSALRSCTMMFCVALSCLSVQHNVRAQAAPPVLLDPLAEQPKFATVTSALGKVVNPRRHNITFEKVGLQPQQAVDITLQYPIAHAGAHLAVEPLDGGRIVNPVANLTVAPNGTFTFRYEVGSKPGLYQIRVHYDSQAVALQFWVVDNAHLDNAPPVLPIN